MDWLQKGPCLINGSKDVLKRSNYHLSYATFSHSMHMWKTKLVLNTWENTLYPGDTNINSGIFQRDSVSPVLLGYSDNP